MTSSVTRRAILAVGAASLLAACGRPQTLFPYTPGQGVNAESASVKVRNLVIAARPGATSGFLSGSLAGNRATRLTSVAGAPIKADGSRGATFNVTGDQYIQVPQGAMVSFVERSAITLASPDLRAGLTAELTLTFSDGDPITLQVPVMDASHPDYATVQPKS